MCSIKYYVTLGSLGSGGQASSNSYQVLLENRDRLNISQNKHQNQTPGK